MHESQGSETRQGAFETLGREKTDMHTVVQLILTGDSSDSRYHPQGTIIYYKYFIFVSIKTDEGVEYTIFSNRIKG